MTKFINISRMRIIIILCAIIGSFIIYFDAYSGDWNSVKDISSNKEFIPVTTTLSVDIKEVLDNQKDTQSRVNFGNAWNSLMKPNIVLSPDEHALTEYVSLLARWIGDKGDYEDQTFNKIYVF